MKSSKFFKITSLVISIVFFTTTNLMAAYRIGGLPPKEQTLGNHMTNIFKTTSFEGYEVLHLPAENESILGIDNNLYFYVTDEQGEILESHVWHS